jgi:hypothetical protein
MTEEEKKNEILKALEKLDKDSSLLNQKKSIEKQSQRKPNLEIKPSAQDKIKAQGKEQNKEFFENLKLKGIQGAMLFFITLIIVNSMTRDQRTTMIENLIIAMLCLGIIASKRR